MTLKDINKILEEFKLSDQDLNKLLEILVWFGHLGIKELKRKEQKDTFIFDVYYDMKKMRAIANNFKEDDLKLIIHPAFWPLLKIADV